MPFMLSPGVSVVEKDYSSIVPAVSTSAGAFCGAFAWGPIEDPLRVSSETDLVSRFGKPVDVNGQFQSFFTAANFLAYTNNLLVTRVDAPNAKNAVSIKSGSVGYNTTTGVPTDITMTSAGSGYVLLDNPTATFSAPDMSDGTTATGTVDFATDGSDITITGIIMTSGGSGYINPPTVTITAPGTGTVATFTVDSIDAAGVKIKNNASYLSAFTNGQSSHGVFAAKYAGTKGNGIRVLMVDSATWDSLTESEQSYFSIAPGTSSFAETNGIADDEVHIIVFDTDAGTFSGVSNSVLEKYTFLSKLSDAKRSDGTNNYYKDVINSTSSYVWWIDHPANLGAATPVYISEPTTNNVVNNSGVADDIGFDSGTKTITVVVGGIADPQYSVLSAYKTFFDAAVARGETREIVVSGSSANSGVYPVESIAFTLELGVVTACVITLKATASITSAASTSGIVISSVPKGAFGISSETAKLLTGSNTMVNLALKVDNVLSGGVDDFYSGDDEIMNAYALLNNTEEYDISLIPVGNVSMTTAKWITQNVAEVRRDCITFISPNATNTTGGDPITSTGGVATTKIIDYRNDKTVGGIAPLSSSYAVLDSGFKYQYDRYNDKYRWVPLNGDVAGLCARTDYVADPWWSPGGFNRGQIKNVVKLAFNPNKTDRDVLYMMGVNPVVSFIADGTVLYGDKTMQAKPSAFDRINVRRLFIVLEKAIAIAAKNSLFEFNDEFTRAQFKSMVEPFLRDVQGRRGIYDFRVKCDEINNSGVVIDRNEFVADIFIKPSRSINFITLNFIAARTSVSFDEIGA